MAGRVIKPGALALRVSGPAGAVAPARRRLLAGWFPAFGTALAFLGVGIIIGFPAVPLALLAGYTASTGPAFADMGYDFKAGWLLRRPANSAAFEREGRRQQYFADLVGFAVGLVIVALAWRTYFSQDLIPPVDLVFADTTRRARRVVCRSSGSF